MDDYNNYNNGNQGDPYQQPYNGSQGGQYQGQYQQSYDGSQSGQYQQNYGGYDGGSYQQQYNGGPQYSPDGPGTGNSYPKFTTYLVLSILMCCCCNQLFGIIAFIITMIGNGNYKSGLPYEGNFKAARIVMIVGLILSILATVISLASGMASALLENAGYNI